MNDLLVAHDLCLRAGPKTVVEGLTLRVEPGQFWAVVGRNGAGKTTLLAALAGIHPAASGRIDLLGSELSRWTPLDAACLRGFLPQHVDPMFGVSVLQAALLGRHPHRGRRMWTTLWDGADDVAVAQAALDQVDMLEFAGRDVASLSGGERQRVAIASLLAQDPLVYLLDEPLSHLDLHHQHAVMRLLRERATGAQRAVLASVHDLSMAARFATHALAFVGNACIAGPAAQVLDEATLSAAFGHRVRRMSQGDCVALVAD